MRSLLIVAVLCGVARGDESEASLSVASGPSVVRVEDLANQSKTASAAGATASVELSYGLSDLWALDVAAGGFAAFNAEYHGLSTSQGDGNVFQDVRGARVLAGITARLAARLIPTVGLHVGYQRRWLENAVLFDDNRTLLRGLPSRSADDFLAEATVGLELRIDRHWIAGLSARAGYVVGGEIGFLSIDVPLRLTYVWYPEWFRSTRRIRFDE